MQSPFTFSTLICTYNRHELLNQTLESLIKNTYEKPDQVVVVNGGDERSDEVVRRFQNHQGIEILLVKTANKNLAASRNIGLPYCRGEIVAMTDDDAQVFPDWVTRMKEVHLENPQAGAVGGIVLGMNMETLVGQVADAITFASYPNRRSVRTLPGVNVSYKRQVVEKIGQQDETLFRGEDVDYNWRVLQLGYEILYDPPIKVYHYHRPTIKSFLNQHYMYGRAYYLVRKKWPEMYCVYPHGIHRMKDLLKAGNFVAGMFYQPFLSTEKLARPIDRLAALPLLFLAGFAWKGGMIRERMFQHQNKS